MKNGSNISYVPLSTDEYGREVSDKQFAKKIKSQVIYPDNQNHIKYVHNKNKTLNNFHTSFLSENKSQETESELLAQLRSGDSSYNHLIDSINLHNKNSPQTHMNTNPSNENSSIENHFAISNISENSLKDFKRYLSPIKQNKKQTSNILFDEYAQNNMINSSNTLINQSDVSFTNSLKNKMQYHQDPYKRGRRYLNESDSKISLNSNHNESFSNKTSQIKITDNNRTSLKRLTHKKLVNCDQIKYNSCEKFQNKERHLNNMSLLERTPNQLYVNLKSYDKVFRESLKGKSNSHTSKYKELKQKVISKDSSQRKISMNSSKPKQFYKSGSNVTSNNQASIHSKKINFEYSLENKPQNQLMEAQQNIKNNSRIKMRIHQEAPKYITKKTHTTETFPNAVIHKFDDTYEKVSFENIQIVSNSKFAKTTKCPPKYQKYVNHQNNNHTTPQKHIYRSSSCAIINPRHHSIDPSRIKYGKLYKKNNNSNTHRTEHRRVINQKVLRNNEISRNNSTSHLHSYGMYKIKNTGEIARRGYNNRVENPYF